MDVRPRWGSSSTGADAGLRVRALPPPVLLIAGAAALVLLVVAPRHGWHRDELYFREAGRHLAWGYVDQPPFTPFIARVADLAAEGNLVVLRLLPAVATAATTALGALIVRELGGDERSQVAGGAAVAAGGFVLGVGHLLSTAVFDLTAWMAVLWLAARMLRTGDPRRWVAIGGVAGVAMLNKNLMPLLVGALVLGLIIERRWDLVASPWAGAGALLALAAASPNLLWQADHGWPQLEMARALSDRLAVENRTTLLPLQLLFAGPLLVPLLLRGARWLARDAEARRFRALLWAWPIALAVTLATAGRPYYPLALTLVVLLAGVVARGQAGARPGRLGMLIAANALVSVTIALPVLPASMAGVQDAMAETVGWTELVEQVADVVDDLPPSEQASVVLLTGSYGEAGAIDRFGPRLDLPPAYSAHNGYADFRRPTDDAATVVAVRYEVSDLSPHFERCEAVATVDNRHDVENEIWGQPIVVCRGLRGTWEQVWSELRHLS